ncbi:MAG: hypothetical protein AB1861_22485 [Cyanobacteriota bacterium]
MIREDKIPNFDKEVGDLNRLLTTFRQARNDAGDEESGINHL